MSGERLDAERSAASARLAAVPGSGSGQGEGRPARTPGAGPRRPGWGRALAVAWIAGAVVTWNTVFDAHIVAGARDYVDRQQLFIDGRGPHVDIDRAMDAAKASGLRAAWGWTAVEAAPGVALAALLRRRKRA